MRFLSAILKPQVLGSQCADVEERVAKFAIKPQPSP